MVVAGVMVGFVGVAVVAMIVAVVVLNLVVVTVAFLSVVVVVAGKLLETELEKGVSEEVVVAVVVERKVVEYWMNICIYLQGRLRLLLRLLLGVA